MAIQDIRPEEVDLEGTRTGRRGVGGVKHCGNGRGETPWKGRPVFLSFFQVSKLGLK